MECVELYVAWLREQISHAGTDEAQFELKRVPEDRGMASLSVRVSVPGFYSTSPPFIDILGPTWTPDLLDAARAYAESMPSTAY